MPSTAFFASRTASGALTVILWASLRASWRTRPLSHKIFTKPKSRMRWASMGSPVRFISIAMLRGSRRGRRKRPPAAATRLRLTSGTPNFETRDATTRSHASTISQPPASANPSTAAMSGLVRRLLTRPANPPSSVETFSPRLSDLRSAPAQNTRGCDDAMIATHRLSSASNLSMSDSIRSETASDTAFIARGRFNVKIATCPLVSYNTKSSLRV